MLLIGYSGHAYVISGILHSMGEKVTGYCDKIEKEYNPLNLKYHGIESSSSALKALKAHGFFICVGNNLVRNNIFDSLSAEGLMPVNAIHPKATLDSSISISSNGVMIGCNVTINAFSKIHSGAICNTHCVIEHECVIERFAHIAPGAILCGNVHVGEHSLIGAGAIIREGIRIGKNVVVGAGSVVVKDIEDNAKVVGYPARNMIHKSLNLSYVNN